MAKKSKHIDIEVATIQNHKCICKIAKQSKYTSAYSNMIFSSEECYEAKRVCVAKRKDIIIGFTCFRHRKRDNTTVLYFIGVDAQSQNSGVGQKLLRDLFERSTGILEFKVMKDNPAVSFYLKRGFKRVGHAFDGKAWIMCIKKPLIQK